MKKNQVPQDEGSLSRNHIREICYAVDENGAYTQVSSSGWEVKTRALDESLALINQRIARAKESVLAGTLSPVAYYMEFCRMDIAILASYTGIHRWFVKRHFRPAVFRRLKEKTLRKYADAFGISVETLTAFSPQAHS